MHLDDPSTYRRALVTLSSVATAAILLWFGMQVVEVFLLAFAGILLALFLRGVGEWLAQHTGLGAKWTTGAFCLALLGLGALGGWLVAPQIAHQADALNNSIPHALSQLTTGLQEYSWGRALISRFSEPKELLGAGSTFSLSNASGLLSSGLGALAGFGVFLFVGLFTAFEPELYRRGALLLVPPAKRAHVASVLSEAGHMLRQWMLGKLLSMLIVGVLTWLGLFLLGIPLALTLALLASVLTFIPNFGPVLSAIPAILLGLMQSPTQALYVILLYLSIQTVESYLLTPIIQRKTAELPPALTLLAQVLLGTLVGGLGVVVATPLTAAAIVFVKRFYVEDVLGDENADLDSEESEQKVKSVARESRPARLNTST